MKEHTKTIDASIVGHRQRKALHAAQAAMTGYFCDYSNKRQPIPVAELKKWVHGHRALRLKLDDAFKQWPTAMREAEIRDWCEEHLKPLLMNLPPDLWLAFGDCTYNSGARYRAVHTGRVIAPTPCVSDKEPRSPIFATNCPESRSVQMIILSGLRPRCT